MKDGKATSLQNWGLEILEELLELNKEGGLSFERIVKEKIEVMKHHELTYSHRISELCQEKGYIAAHMALAKKYKEEAFLDRFRLKPYTDLELSTQILIKEGIKRGIRFEIVDRKENFIALTKGTHTEYITPTVFKEMAVKASKAVGANICGADIMIEDLHHESSSYAIIELNFNPAIHIHSFPYQGTERNVAYKILKLLGFV